MAELTFEYIPPAGEVSGIYLARLPDGTSIIVRRSGQLGDVGADADLVQHLDLPVQAGQSLRSPMYRAANAIIAS